jgi:hypothetical protein
MGGAYTSLAHDANQCDVVFDQTSPPTYHYGHEHRDVCHAGDGADSMYAYGGFDDFYGGKGDDRQRGANGGDELHDADGEHDWDRFCDGDEHDGINMGDGDAIDHFHAVQDAWSETIIRNVGDEYHSQGDFHNDCPM